MLGTMGDDAERFCDEVGPRLVGSLTLYLGDRGVAEEIAQDALVRAWERWDEVRQMEHPEAWVFRVATNLARSWFRRRGAERRARARLEARPPDPGSLGDLDDAVLVRRAVSTLPERQRAAVVARFFLGLSVAETADALGMAEGTVKASTHQALANLRRSGLLADVTTEESVR
jgi:RNA polymerase sigma-70 factor (ECF subfamily)